MNKEGMCVLWGQGNDMVISKILYTGSLCAKITLNIPLFILGQKPFIFFFFWGGEAWLSYSLVCESLDYNFLISVLASLLPLVTTTNFFNNRNFCSHLYYAYRHNCDLILQEYVRRNNLNIS